MSSPKIAMSTTIARFLSMTAVIGMLATVETSAGTIRNAGPALGGQPAIITHAIHSVRPDTCGKPKHPCGQCIVTLSAALLDIAANRVSSGQFQLDNVTLTESECKARTVSDYNDQVKNDGWDPDATCLRLEGTNQGDTVVVIATYTFAPSPQSWRVAGYSALCDSKTKLPIDPL